MRRKSSARDDEQLVANPLAEWLMRSHSSVVMFVGHAVYALSVSGVIWLFEFVMFSRGIGEWLSIRWYVPLALVIASTLISTVLSRNREEEANTIFGLSEEVDSSLALGGESISGQLRVDHHPVDLVSVTATRHGIFLSKRSKIRAFFSWQKVARVRVHRSTKQHLRAELAIPFGASSRELQFEVPWTKAMSRFVPPELRVCKQN